MLEMSTLAIEKSGSDINVPQILSVFYYIRTIFKPIKNKNKD